MIGIKIKQKVLKLRREGKSINEIAKRLKLAKSTISQWCRNIQLTPKQIKNLIKKQLSGSYRGRMKFLEKIRKERMTNVVKLRKEGMREIGKISRRDLFIGGIAMYWSEGATSSSNEEVSFSNSDPKMILYMMKWFKETCRISNGRFIVQIRINRVHKFRIKEIENYWSKFLRIPLIQFSKTILIKTKPKKVYPNFKDYYGTVRLKVRRGTLLRRRINGWIEGLAKIVNLPA